MEMGLLLLATPFLLFPTLFPVGTAVALVGLGVIWVWVGWGTGRFLPFTPFNLVLLVWLLAVLVGTLVSADPALTLPKLTGLLLGITLWRTLVLRVQTNGQLWLAVSGFLGAAAGMILIAALSLDWPAKLPFLATLVTRLPSNEFLLPESSPEGVQANQLAGTLLLSWPLSVALAVRGWPKDAPLPRLGRGIALALAVGGALVLILTQSRLGWFGGLAGIGALVWLNRVRHQGWPRVYWLLLAAPGLVLLLAALPHVEQWVMAQVEPGTTTPLGTLAYRFEVWRYALEAVGNFPLTGTGLGTFRAVVLRLYPITVFPQPDVSHAHNVFLQIALDTGIPGLIAYVALMGLTLFMGWRWIRRTEAQETGIAIGVMACLIAFHLFGLGDTIALGAKPGLLFWWLLGFAAASDRILHNQSTQ